MCVNVCMHELVQDPIPAHYIRLNLWSDPMLEQPEFIEVREKLRMR